MSRLKVSNFSFSGAAMEVNEALAQSRKVAGVLVQPAIPALRDIFHILTV
jgi:hypothetical protein